MMKTKSSSSSSNSGGAKLFPKFNSQIPMTYEKVRVLLEAIMTGERDLANAVESNLRLEADAKKARTTVHFLRFDELLNIWIDVLAKLPVLRTKFDDSKSEPEQVLRDALDMLEGEGRVAFRYVENCNGSQRDIAGVLNAEGNVLGMMPHPERAVEQAHGGTDGLALFENAIKTLVLA